MLPDVAFVEVKLVTSALTLKPLQAEELKDVGRSDALKLILPWIVPVAE
jgi:hypothetical protein